MYRVCVCFTDPRKKYHIKLLAFSFMGDGYQADQTISTPGCVCEFKFILIMLCRAFPGSESVFGGGWSWWFCMVNQTH